MPGSLPCHDLHFGCPRAKDIVADPWPGNKTRGCVLVYLSQFSSASNNQSILYGCSQERAGVFAVDSGRTIGFRQTDQSS